MDAALFHESIEYELLTQAVYQAILAKQYPGTISVQHNVDIAGRSGVAHQIDVYWEFKQAGLTHRVLIECKNYGQNVNLEKARNFFGVLHDIGNALGIMVTKTGYQSGAADFCKFYGIALKLLREPTDKDWEGRIRTIHINITPRMPVSTADRPIVCNLNVQAQSEEQDKRLRAAVAANPSLFALASTTRFVDKNGTQITEDLSWWLPKQIDVLKHPDGGPYKQAIELKDHYLPVDLGQGPEFVRAIGVIVEFYVETLAAQKIIVNAADTVDAILKDFETGKWEHVHKTKS